MAGVSRLLGGILLVAGTTIGAAMLALPISTGIIGWWPSVLLFVVVWFFMTYSALLMLEVNFAIGEHTNMVTMARRTLGPIGEICSWFAYLLLLYALMSAYISGCGAILLEWIHMGTQIRIPDWAGPIPFALVFGALIYLGVRPADLLNRVLMSVVGFCFVVLVIMVAPRMNGMLLDRANLPWIMAPLAVVVTSFGYHIILPTLSDYLDRDLHRMKLCLWWGSVVPLVAYLVWECLILGVIPLPALQAMLSGGQPAASLTHTLATATGYQALIPITAVFSFVVILTSFLGVSLSLHDFLVDGLRVHETNLGRLGAVALTFVPPLIFAWAYPHGFITALRYGGLLVAILLGIFPVLMAWSLRYRKRTKVVFQAFGGKVMLTVAMLFFVWVVVGQFVGSL